MIRGWLNKLTDPDQALCFAMNSCIEAAAVRYALDARCERYREGEPLKLFLANYVGSRNTGSDVRVEEIIRQLRAILGDDNLQLTTLTFDPSKTANYFRAVRQVRLPRFFPTFLAEEVPRHHGVIACEGSMFKSKFSNALSIMMAGALGLAANEGKLGVGYGGEAGAMDDSLARFVRKHCQQALVICRNEPSRRVLGGLGVRTSSGTDTAWTFEPARSEVGFARLREVGWDGVRPLLIVCPINPFFWPAKPDLIKTAALKLAGQFGEDHYDAAYFHTWSEAAERRYAAYLDGLARATREFVSQTDAFLVCVGMEALDRMACEELMTRLPKPAPMLISDEHDMYTLVSVLRHASLLVTSRYHAMVTSMPAGVPSVGVTMDERISNLLRDRGHPQLLLRVDEPGLGERLLSAMRLAYGERERLRAEIRAFVPGQLRVLGQMGMDFEAELLRIYPNFPRRDVPRTPEHYLPQLSPELLSLLEAHA
jgi:polysaccharide pyruvyl transferase WcaK-like protein